MQFTVHLRANGSVSGTWNCSLCEKKSSAPKAVDLILLCFLQCIPAIAAATTIAAFCDSACVKDEREKL